ncbi:MAG TPA: HupE/UreJ family protein [Kofleriaceae bacterium]|nr:HupE/UreJ family protein [Kofleriaceae bacterium]
MSGRSPTAKVDAGPRRGAKCPWIAAVIVLAALAAPARAHQTSVKYIDVTVEGPRASIALTVAPGDVAEPLGLPPDAQPTVAQAAVPAVAAYVAGWLALGPDPGPPCPAGRPAAAADADARFVVVRWQVACAADLVRVAVDLRAFFAVDVRHEAFVTVHAAGAPGGAVVVRAADPILRVQAGEAMSLAGWIAAGVEHIWDGRDHVSFVLALLLVVMLVRGDAGWDVRPPLATLRRTATIITAFTVAHSLSLIAASLGWVRLPGRLVESLIAVSILYTAIENIIRPDVRWRFVLTFGFGLVHGLGFASVLAVMLPPDHVIAPLLGFNLGVEIGQLVIVAIALPLAWLAARELGAERYRRGAMPALSVAIGVLAVKWLIERVFVVSLLTFWGM